MPRVSVIIPTFNCARFIERAIDSASAQTYQDYELLVADDGSTDDTKEVVVRYGRKVTYLYQPNRGVSAARNHAILNASGDLLAFLDADDVWYPQKLERQVAFLDAHPECGMVHSEVSVITEDDEIVYRRFNAETQRPVPQGYCLLQLLQRCHVQTLTVVERRNCFDRVGGFDERLPISEDYLHWMMIASEGHAVGYLAEPLAKYRWRHGSLMGSRTRQLEEHIKIYGILLEEHQFGAKHGEEAAAILRDRLFEAQKDLAYLDRIQGRRGSARRRLTNLIKERPREVEIYVNLLKACIPESLLSKLRTLKSPGR